jgi:tetratricopeptide (TPR) repeat protein
MTAKAPKPKQPTREALAALDRAQRRVYDAWEAARPATRIKRAQEALAISPLCADAHVILAEHAPFGSAERMAAWEAGVAAGEAALGPRGFKEMAGEFWGWHETRPYMRARLGLAAELLHGGREREALPHLRDLLRLNPNDNQGVRTILAGALADLGEDEELGALLDRYIEDEGADMAWTRALLAFRRGGDGEASRAALAAARDGNPHVPAYLTGATPMPKSLPPYYSPGDASEAALYADRFAEAWGKTPGALAWIAAQAGKAKPRRGAGR